MNFEQAIRTAVQQRYADFQGRSRRAEYWYFALMMFVLNLISQAIGGVIALLIGLVSLLLLIPGIAVTVRRLHDLDKSGWFALLLLIPIVNIVLILIWFTQPGTKGPNRYGPDPVGAETPAST
ncbi:DUF805 domain-containing protein [Histidinibacterium aquaticum]|uniref:DUF805 domain-containing protein n=1 Tax=Histidinibacterium aquaticum TaxID=2613962 RepID=A0A5J5GI54_9RHOB|nr:DUF805 domain-containing protein [Histidinibacterium aquaticum]KAA9007797.1 DUF805 domain-containing protein [Histidinibacterium aquaticum]